MDLVIMAAGMGSRFGGLKQMEPVTPQGEAILDFSVRDAKQAGFTRCVFVITRAMEALFRERFGDRIARLMEICCVYQDLEDIPAGFTRLIPDRQGKPWGTGHALLAARHVVKAPFAVINADDFYGEDAFCLAAGALRTLRPGHWMMVGYRLENTLTDYGSVARGVCAADEAGFLTDVVEHTNIRRQGSHIVGSAGDKEVVLAPETTVSMNFWGFDPSVFGALEQRFSAFLAAAGPKSEYFLPDQVGKCVKAGEVSVQVLPSPGRWYGITYREDIPAVSAAISALRAGR